MLTQEQSSLLARMRAASREAGPPFCALDHWERVHAEFDAWFARDGIGCVEEQDYNGHFASYPPTNPAYCAYATFMQPVYHNDDQMKCYVDACNFLYDIIRKKDRWGILDCVETALPEDSSRCIVIGDRRYSWDVLISLDSLLTIAAAWPRILDGPCLVADLGAGWGRMGFVLKQVNPQATYVVYDLPESLLLSSTYLPTIMPGEKFHLYDDTRGVAVERDGGVWMLPAQDLGIAPDKSIDCFINIASFQEMTNGYVDAYSDLITCTVGGVFYSLQAADRYFFQRWHVPVGTYPRISWHNYYLECVYEVGNK